jgi:hypothetical protein
VELDALVELDPQGRAKRFQRGEELPLRGLAVDFDAVDGQMAGVEEDVAGLAICDGLQAVDDISGQLLLVEQDLEIGRDVGGQPVVVVGQGVWIAGRVDDGRHAAGWGVDLEVGLKGWPGRGVRESLSEIESPGKPGEAHVQLAMESGIRMTEASREIFIYAGPNGGNSAT